MTDTLQSDWEKFWRAAPAGGDLTELFNEFWEERKESVDPD